MTELICENFNLLINEFSINYHYWFDLGSGERNGPGTNFEMLGTLPKGEEVFVIEESNGWCKIDFDEKWLSRNFLDFH